MSNLSGIFAVDESGLPRGRTSLDNGQVREEQRRRIIRGAISAFADKGYASTTIADIVKNARVSRQVFYEIFTTKDDCFLAAEELGRQALQPDILKLASPVTKEPDQWIRAFIHSYLKLCQDESQFTKAWALEFPNVSKITLQRRNEFFSQLGRALRQGHLQFRQHEASVRPLIADLFYDMAIGGAYEIIYRYISQNRFTELASLEDILVKFVLHTLEYDSQDVIKAGH